MAKKPEGKMDKHAMQAKMDVIQELLEMAQEAMAGKVKGGMDEMQKISVMAPDKESLSHGLDMAKMLSGESEESEEDESEESSPDVESSEEPSLMSMEDESEESSSPFMKKSASQEKRKKMFSMDDED